MQPIRGNVPPLSSGPVSSGGHLSGSGQPIVSGGGHGNVGVSGSVGGSAVTRFGSRSNSGGPFSISEALDVIRREYDNVAGQMVSLHSERRELEVKLESQLEELNIIRRTLFELESQHSEIKQQYEDELVRLRSELNSIRHAHNERSSTGSGASSVSGRMVSSSGPVDVGNRMSPVTSASMGAPAAMRPSPDQQQRQTSHGALSVPRDLADSDRDRDAERARGREGEWERERDRDGRIRLDREREVMGRATRSKSLRDDIDERENDRIKDGRDAKRVKLRRDYQSPGTGPDYLPHSAEHRHVPPMTMSPSSSTNTLEELSFQSVPPEFRKEGPDWFALYNPRTRKALDVTLIHAFMHPSVVCCVQFSADGQYLATGCNRTAQIYNTRTGDKVCVVEDETAAPTGDLYIRSVRFSPDGKYLATGAEDKKIRIWEISSRRILHVFQGHEQEIYSLDFSRDGRYIVSGSGDKTMRIWDLVDPAAHRTITIADSGPAGAPHDAGVTSVAISPDGNWVAAGSLDCIIRVWNVRTGKMVERLKGHEDSVYSVAFTPNGKGLVSGSLDRSLKYWDITEAIEREGEGAASMNRELRSFVGHKVGTDLIRIAFMFRSVSFGQLSLFFCNLAYRWVNLR
ncbi:WD40-repeat-containing domain protein [Panaeolus papilionaceus]|nr:WD40-repeat-containing domain protein [Panaeolus papilionaceus]